ncbi:MAG: class I SAM-dependent RNA methyltransferase, partial [Bdellovibrionales bacterium]|nr:class I SAM-dependent RNA methyltransferase [Bdellovibrionales bacterium]
MATTVEVKVRGLAVGGAGVGSVVEQDGVQDDLLGITAFVPFSIPGETINARVRQRKQNHIDADLLEISDSSPDRVEPPCPYFTKCGGCELQHMSYASQLAAKHAMVNGALRSGRLPASVLCKLKPFIGSDPYHYRRRLQLHIDSSGRVGLYRPQSRSVVPLDDCPISVEAIRGVLRGVQPFGARVKGIVSSLVFEADPQGVIAVATSPYDVGKREVELVVGAAREFFDSFIFFSSNREAGGYGRSTIELTIGAGNGVRLQFPAGAFSQVNWPVNRELVRHVLASSEAGRGATVVDLYSGAGNFSVPLARAGCQVQAVECDERLTQLCAQNA